jgi:hypothetical protein
MGAPGDIILDRYLPNASPEQREEARENLRRLARLSIRVHERLARERGDNPIRANGTAELESESISIEV